MPTTAVQARPLASAGRTWRARVRAYRGLAEYQLLRDSGAQQRGTQWR